MKTNNPLLITLAALTLPFSSLHAEEVKSSMQGLLLPLKKLQPFLASEERFTDPENSEDISTQLQAIRSNFHSIETIPSRYKTLPGFQESIRNVTELLDDSARRFQEGKRSYTWWRMQGLPTDCFSCHATYKVTSSISSSEFIDPSLSPLERSKFLLATRQFSEAKQSLLSVLQDPSYRLYYDLALRSLLLVETRNSTDPQEAISLFQGILSTTQLPDDDTSTVKRWIIGLQTWSKSKPVKEADKLTVGEKLILQGATRGIDYGQDDVALLRGTALVHQGLESGKLSEAQRRKGLYLLGYAYSHLSHFFTEGWSEMYLEKCIEDFPNTQEAKWAFAIYRSKVMEDFTGSSGSHVPDEVKLHLEELRKKAFGQTDFSPKI